MGKGDGSCAQRSAMAIQAPAPAVTMPAARQLERMYTFADARSGLRAQVNKVWRSSGRRDGQVINGELLDADGNPAGSFQRSMFIDGRGRLVVEHGSLQVNAGLQGRGFARAFNAACLRRYRQAGVDCVITLAERVGAYAWARDFEFRCEWAAEDERPHLQADQARRMLHGREQQIEDLVATGKITRELADTFLARFASRQDLDTGRLDGKFTSPAQIAAFGREQTWTEGRHTMWLGKVFLIGNPWDGMKLLSRGDEA